jgi:hypothetical protein
MVMQQVRFRKIHICPETRTCQLVKLQAVNDSGPYIKIKKALNLIVISNPTPSTCPPRTVKRNPD